MSLLNFVLATVAAFIVADVAVVHFDLLPAATTEEHHRHHTEPKPAVDDDAAQLAFAYPLLPQPRYKSRLLPALFRALVPEPSIHELAFRGNFDRLEGALLAILELTDKRQGGDQTRASATKPEDQDTAPSAEAQAAAASLAGSRDAYGNTPLHFAAKGGQLQIAQLLLSVDPVLHTRNNDAGTSPLHWACTARGLQGERIQDFLLSSGISADATNKALETPLHWAVYWQNLGAVSTLLHASADPNLADVNGDTPLHRISKDCEHSEECEKIVAALLLKGADALAENQYGRTPLAHFGPWKDNASDPSPPGQRVPDVMKKPRGNAKQESTSPKGKSASETR